MVGPRLLPWRDTLQAAVCASVTMEQLCSCWCVQHGWPLTVFLAQNSNIASDGQTRLWVVSVPSSVYWRQTVPVASVTKLTG